MANKQQDVQAGQLGQSDERVSFAAAITEPITPQDSYVEAAEYTMGRSRLTPVIMTAGMWEESSDWDSIETDSSTHVSESGVSVTGYSSQQAASAATPALQAPGWLPAFTSPCVLAGVLAMVVASLPVLRVSAEAAFPTVHVLSNQYAQQPCLLGVQRQPRKQHMVQCACSASQ